MGHRVQALPLLPSRRRIQAGQSDCCQVTCKKDLVLPRLLVNLLTKAARENVVKSQQKSHNGVFLCKLVSRLLESADASPKNNVWSHNFAEEKIVDTSADWEPA